MHVGNGNHHDRRKGYSGGQGGQLAAGGAGQRLRHPRPVLLRKDHPDRRLPAVHGQDRRTARHGPRLPGQGRRGDEGHGLRRAARGDAQDAGRRAALRAQRRVHHLRARRRLRHPGPGFPLRAGHAQAQLRPDLADHYPGPGRHLAGAVLRFQQVHQVRALRQGLHRDPGQGRPEHGPARHPQPRRGRHRPVVGLGMRRLRRVHPGLPGGRPDGEAGLRQQAEEKGRAEKSGHHLPVLRRRLPAGALDQGRQDRQGQGRGLGAQLRRHLRQGPLRPRFRPAPRPPDQALDPQGRQAGGSQLGRSAGPGGRQARRHQEGARPRRPGRPLVGQVHQRGEFRLPEVRAHGFRLQQRRPLRPPVPRLDRGRPGPLLRLRRHDQFHRRAGAAPRSSWSPAPTPPRPTRSSPRASRRPFSSTAPS